MSQIPYGQKLDPNQLQRAWLKPGDIHLVKHFYLGRYDAGHLERDLTGKLSFNSYPLKLKNVDHVVLYPAPVEPDEQSAQVAA